MPWFLINSFVTMLLLYAITGTLLEFRFDKIRRLLVISLAICLTVFLDGWNYFHGSGIAGLYSRAWITTGIPNFLALLYLSKYRDFGFLFVYLTVSVIASISSFLSFVLAFLLPGKSLAIPFLIHTATLVVIFLVCRRLFQNRFFEAARYQGKRWLIYCTLPFICIVAWVMYNNSPSRLMDMVNKIYLPYAGYIYPHDIPLYIAVLVMVFYTISLILIIITVTFHTNREREEKATMDFQIQVLKERLFSLEERDESLRILRHDMRHHLSTLSVLIDNQVLSGAQEYINQLDLHLMQVEEESYCRNVVINSVISFYKAIAKRENIRFSALVQIPDPLPVDDMDIGAVLSNVLENAHNACSKLTPDQKRFIDIRFIQHKKQFVLDVSNSFDDIVVFDLNNRPVSQMEGHGIGSQSIFAFARKYDASIDYSAKDGVFEIQIMFTEINREINRDGSF